jgi:hypothetical protein
MSVELVVVDVSGGYAIEIKSGELNHEKYNKFLERVYKHKHVAVARKKAIEEEARAEQ